ncbi:MAG: peptidyl-prolyl cis-trans isomerase A (cyclophilin A) [Myxococcota bacterium]|jgi:peptidyl-prolyl cis-trans isomerase A (cyclophilin A)
MRHLLILTCAAALFVACDSKPKVDPKPEPVAAAKTPAPAAANKGEAKAQVKKVVAEPAPVPQAKPPTGPVTEALTDPSKATLTAPATFKAKFTTTKGDIVIEVTRAWAPLGADRFFNLVKAGFFQDIAMFRVIPGFMGQFGIHGDPKVSAAWKGAKIKDDPVTQSNTRGMVTFAMAGKNTRTTQLFINFSDGNKRLDGMGFPPFGKVVGGMDIVDKIHSGYGEGAPRGRGPAQGRVQGEGNAYLKKDFPNLDYIVSAEIVQ